VWAAGVFADYVALVKNLRGAVLRDPREDGAERRVAWLAQRFRYRNLGVPPALVAAHADFLHARLRGKPFVELAFPLASLERVAAAVAGIGETGRPAAEAMVLASAYASPLICPGAAAVAAVRPYAVDTVETKVTLSDKDWRLHFRIADYTVLDLYQWSTDHARRLWREVANDLTQARRQRIAKDKKRYWRLQQGDGPPHPFLFYLDLADRVAEDCSLRTAITQLPEGEACAALAIVPVVAIP
jgi:hypothetical protein